MLTIFKEIFESVIQSIGSTEDEILVGLGPPGQGRFEKSSANSKKSFSIL